jgi:hypothetical protein
MGKTRKAMIAFIDSIPDSKLEGGIKSDTVYTDKKNFRLDNQGVCLPIQHPVRTPTTC